MKKVTILFFLISFMACSSLENANKRINNENMNNDTNEKIESEDIKKILNRKEDNELNENNKVYIFESYANKSSIDKIKEKLKDIDFENISEYYDVEKNNNSHDYQVVKAFFDFNNDYILDENRSIKNVLKVGSYNDLKKRKNAEGIINMSYGFNNYNVNMIALSSSSQYIENNIDEMPEKDFFMDSFSNLIFDKKYNENKMLKIKSLGNSESNSKKTQYNSIDELHLYEIMSPEMQKKSRSEVLLVKNMVEESKKNLSSYFNTNRNTYTDSNGIKYYEVEKKGYHNAIPLLLRSNTVSYDGFLYSANTKGGSLLNSGSSFSAPKISRLAYEIKRKYPFLTYHQVKQIILTTANRESEDYLSDISGWGYANFSKALKGISNLNAGLIEEQKYFKDYYHKIYDENGNIYLYLDVDNSSYEFSNDISSGLKGDGNNLSSYEIDVNGALVYDEDGYYKERLYKLRIPKVLDSEKNYYSNIKQAGLRKAGKGELVLSGFQNYETKTQVLDGILTLKNSSNSNYEVFEKASLKIDGNNNNLKNIYSNGLVDFKSKNVQADEYVASEKSKTLISTDSKLKFNKFKVSGSLKIDFKDDITGLRDIVDSKEIDISKTKLENIYLKFDENLKIEEITSNSKIRKLKDLTEEELRNIPSYKINEKRFFDGFSEENIVAKRNIYNISSNSINEDESISNIFTDNYSSFISNLIENNNALKENLTSLNFEDNKNLIGYNNLKVRNVFSGDKYISFANKLDSHRLDFSYKVNDNLNISLLALIGNAQTRFNNGTDFVYNFNQYSLINRLNKIFNLNLSNISSINLFEVNISRNFGDEKIESDLSGYILNNSLNVSKNYDFMKSKFSPYLEYGLDYVKINPMTENNKYGINLKENNILKHSASIGFNVKTELNDKVKMTNNLDFKYIFNNKIDLEANILGVDLKLKGKDLEKYTLTYKFGLDFNVYKNMFLNIESSINTVNKMKLSTSFKYEY